jgi:hypothetical protein
LTNREVWQVNKRSILRALHGCFDSQRQPSVIGVSAPRKKLLCGNNAAKGNAKRLAARGIPLPLYLQHKVLLKVTEITDDVMMVI